MTGTPDVAGAPGREIWIDAGRGLAVILVVLYHAARWFDVSAWEQVNDYVSSVRMPFFFMISGLLAYRVGAAAETGSSWRTLWDRRLRLYLWVFVIWECVGTACYLIGFALRGTPLGFGPMLRDLLLSPVRPQFELWFIWALALFCVIARLLRSLDWRWHLLGAAVPSVIVLTDGFDLGNIGWNGALKYYIFFVCGMNLRVLLLRFARTRWAVRAGLLLGWALMATVVEVAGLRSVVGVYFVLCAVGILAGVALGTFLARSAGLVRIGSSTLSVYLGHTPVIIVGSSLVFALIGSTVLPGVAGILAVPVAAAVAIALSWLVHRWTASGPLRYLYVAPEGNRWKQGLRVQRR
ncbi:acyltransferase family protein [Promicromonospora sp. NPDC023987]|uniref:acyltransferase family protein n=1 Tax=Promicromonospora sp. NPDC023987 TaxID=3155360 RepID=UPI00340B6609